MPFLDRFAKLPHKSMRLAMTCGYRVFVCSNMAFAGDFTPVLAKHSKSFSLIDCISVGVDRMQRNFEPMRKQVDPSSLRDGTGADRFFLTSDLSRRLTGCRLTPYKPVSG